MATKTNKSAGSQSTPKGPVQGQVLVDSKTGDPIETENGKLATTATITAQTIEVSVELDAANDSVRVEDPDTDAHVKVETDGSINANVEIDASDGDNIAINDSDGDELEINVDGSVNVRITDDPNTNIVNTYAEVNSVATSTPTTIATYTAPVGKTSFLQRVSFSGTNIAKYDLKINDIILDRKYVHFGQGLSDNFEFIGAPGKNGHKLTTGDVITLVVKHERPGPGDFNARIQSLET